MAAAAFARNLVADILRHFAALRPPATPTALRARLSRIRANTTRDSRLHDRKFDNFRVRLAFGASRHGSQTCRRRRLLAKNSKRANIRRESAIVRGCRLSRMMTARRLHNDERDTESEGGAVGGEAAAVGEVGRVRRLGG